MDTIIAEKRTASVNVRMEPEVKELLRRLAAEKGSTTSQIAREAAVIHLRRHGYKPYEKFLGSLIAPPYSK